MTRGSSYDKHFALLLFALAAPSLLAQNFDEITGTVTDATGAVIPGVVVTVVNPATNQMRTATTNEAGIYSVPSLVPGLYEVRAENTGFKMGVRRGVELEVGAVARIDSSMEVGDIPQQRSETAMIDVKMTQQHDSILDIVWQELRLRFTNCGTMPETLPAQNGGRW